MFKIILILTMILCGAEASEAKGVTAAETVKDFFTGIEYYLKTDNKVKNFFDDVLQYFYVFSGSKYLSVTEGGGRSLNTASEYDWKFDIEKDKLCLKYVGKNSDNFGKKYFITPDGFKALMGQLAFNFTELQKIISLGPDKSSLILRTSSEKHLNALKSEMDFTIDCEGTLPEIESRIKSPAGLRIIKDSNTYKRLRYLSNMLIDKDMPVRACRIRKADQAVGTGNDIRMQNYKAESEPFDVEGITVDNKPVIIKMKKSFFSENFIYGLSNYWSEDQRKRGVYRGALVNFGGYYHNENDYSDCLYVISTDPAPVVPAK